MTIIEDQCQDCHKPVKFKFQQTVIQEQLRWSVSCNCPFCSFAIELDDIGLLPEDIRQKIFQEEGEWEIIIENFEQQKQRIIKSLRQILGLSTMELYQKLKELRGRPGAIQSGTKFEMNWLYSRLQLDGVESIVLKCKEVE
jgi:hypothetical protein